LDDRRLDRFIADHSNGGTDEQAEDRTSVFAGSQT